MSTNVQAMTIAMFGAAAGGYTAELEASVEASGVAAVANSIMSLQQPLLGLDLSDNAVWTDFVLGNLGINDTNAAYGEASAYFAARFAAGASRGDIIAEAVAYLLGTVSEEFAAVAEAFVAQVETAVEWSAGDGATVLSIGDLRDAADNGELDGSVGDAAVFNLTAALATLKADNAAVTSFLKALDLDADGKADNAGDVTLNRNAITEGGEGTLDTKISAVDALVDAANTTALDWFALTAAQRDAELAKAKVNLAAVVTNKQTDVDLAQANVNKVTGLATAIAEYEAAVAAQKAADATEQKTTADLTAALTKYNVDASAANDVTRDVDTGDYENGVAAVVIDVDAAKYTAVLGTGITETTNPGITALLAAVNADLAAEKALAAANSKLNTEKADLDLADGGTDDAGAVGDFGEVDGDPFAVAADAPTYSALLDAKAALKTAQTNVTNLDKAVAALVAVQAQESQLKALDKAVAADKLAIATAGYDLNGAGYDFTTGTDLVAGAQANEKEVYTVKFGTGAVTFETGDVIVVSGFTYNTGKIDTAGDNSKLEYFVTEVAGSTVITMEQVAYGSNSTAVGSEAEVAITLTGVTMDKLVFGADYITLA